MDKNLFKKHSKLMSSIWDKAKKKSDSGQIGDTFEDGRYKMLLKDAQASESQSGNFMVVFSFEFLEGAYVGKVKKAFRVITPDRAEDNLARILMDINKFGFEIEEFEQIESALEELRNSRAVVRVTLKTRSGSDYQDAYIDKVLTGEESENTEDVVDSGEEIPSEEIVEESIELNVGTKVKFSWKGEELEGEVKEIDEANGKSKVKVDNKVYPVKLEDLSLVEEEVVEEAEEVAEEVPEEPEVENDTEEDEEDVKPSKKVVKKTGKDLKKKKK